MSTIPGFIDQHTPNVLAFWRPAVDKKNFKVDTNSLSIRTVILAGLSLGALISSLSPVRQIIFLATCYLHLPLEKMRAARALNEIAVNTLLKSNDLNAIETSLTHMSANPAALSKYLEQPNPNKDYLNTILKEITKRTEDSFSNESKQSFASFKIIADKDLLDAQSFIPLNDQCKTYALNSGKLTPQDFTPEQICTLWLRTGDSELAKALVKNGFDINSEKEGKTPLSQALLTKQLQTVCFYLTHGAKVPEKIVTEENPSGITPQEYLKDRPDLLAALKQQGGTSIIQPVQSSFFSLAPHVNINTRNDSFETRNEDLFLRTYLAASVAISGLLTGILHQLPLYQLPSLALAGATALYYRFEVNRSAEKLNDLALREFQTRFPFHGVTNYIARNEAVFDQIDKNDLSKLDDKGKTLWNTICEHHLFSIFSSPISERLPVFKKLANHLFTSNISTDEKFNLFLEAIKSDRPELVKYLLEQHLISAKDLTPKQQIHCWMKGNKETCQHLVKAGFDINAQSKYGFTALHLSLYQSHAPLFSDFKYAERVLFLLQNGATLDRDHKVKMRVRENNVRESVETTVAELIEKSSGSIKLAIQLWKKTGTN